MHYCYITVPGNKVVKTSSDLSLTKNHRNVLYSVSRTADANYIYVATFSHAFTLVSVKMRLSFISPALCSQCRSLLRSSAPCSPRQHCQVDLFASQWRSAVCLSPRCPGTKTPRFCPPATSASSSTTETSTRCCCSRSSPRTPASTAARPRTTTER